MKWRLHELNCIVLVHLRASTNEWGRCWTCVVHMKIMCDTCVTWRRMWRDEDYDTRHMKIMYDCDLTIVIIHDTWRLWYTQHDIRCSHLYRRRLESGHVSCIHKCDDHDMYGQRTYVVDNEESLSMLDIWCSTIVIDVLLIVQGSHTQNKNITENVLKFPLWAFQKYISYYLIYNDVYFKRWCSK